MDEGERPGFNARLHSFTNAGQVSADVDPRVFQCHGPGVHVFESERDPGMCPVCGDDVGMASARNMKAFRDGQ